MDRPVLTHPVITLDKELLFLPGVELTPERIDEVLNSAQSNRSIKFGRFDTVTSDMLEFIATPPYNTVFKDNGALGWLMDDLSESEFPVEILDTLRYFKEEDPHTYRHQLMVFALSGLVARDLIPERGNIMRLAMAGPVHDIGKVCVPLKILKKRTPLTREERKMLDNHSAAGYVLLSYYGQGHQHIGPIVARDHHERRDGSGKPTRKRLQNLLVEIIAVCDIYDALISPRPYRPISYDNRSALEELTSLAQKGIINMDIVKIIVAHNRNKRPYDIHCPVSEEKRGHEPDGNIYGMTEAEPDTPEKGPQLSPSHTPQAGL